MTIRGCAEHQIAWLSGSGARAHANSGHRGQDFQLEEFAEEGDIPEDYEVRGGVRKAENPSLAKANPRSPNPPEDTPEPQQAQETEVFATNKPRTRAPVQEWSERVEHVAAFLKDISPPVKPSTARSLCLALENEDPSVWVSPPMFQDVCSDCGLMSSQARQLMRLVGLKQTPYPPAYGQPWGMVPHQETLSREDMVAAISAMNGQNQGSAEITELKLMVVGLANELKTSQAVRDAIQQVKADLAPEMDRLRDQASLAGSGVPYESSINRIIELGGTIAQNFQRSLDPIFNLVSAQSLMSMGLSASSVAEIMRLKQQQEATAATPPLSGTEAENAHQARMRWDKTYNGGANAGGPAAA
jgi:hypothetical protein